MQISKMNTKDMSTGIQQTQLINYIDFKKTALVTNE